MGTIPSAESAPDILDVLFKEIDGRPDIDKAPALERVIEGSAKRLFDSKRMDKLSEYQTIESIIGQALLASKPEEVENAES